MDILPNALIECLATFRPCLRHEVFLTFTYLMTSVLVGEAKWGAVRASVFAPARYQPTRKLDFFTTHRVSPQRLMATLVTLVLRCIYGDNLPTHLFWLGDSTLTEKPFAGRGWYLPTTDRTLTATRVMQVYAGRQQIEVNFDEVKELGLGHYQGRSGTGVRRWAVLLCLAQACLKLAATGHLKITLPLLHWSWYKKENTVGQIRRRLIEHCRPRISRTLPSAATTQESVNSQCSP